MDHGPRSTLFGVFSVGREAYPSHSNHTIMYPAIQSTQQRITMEQPTTSLKPNFYMVALIVIAMLALAATYEWEWALQLSSFAFFLGKIALGLICVKTIDDWVFPGINTIQKLNEGNLAVAAHQLALYVLVALALVST